jgi:PTS system cellobiose-specific IIB component
MSKKQIYLFCDAGMSTSIMVNKMMEVVEISIICLFKSLLFRSHVSQEVVEKEKPVAILLGPQVKFSIGKNTRSNSHH